MSTSARAYVYSCDDVCITHRGSAACAHPPWPAYYTHAYIHIHVHTYTSSAAQCYGHPHAHCLFPLWCVRWLYIASDQYTFACIALASPSPLCAALLTAFVLAACVWRSVCVWCSACAWWCSCEGGASVVTSDSSASSCILSLCCAIALLRARCPTWCQTQTHTGTQTF